MKTYTLSFTEKQFEIVQAALLHCMDKPHTPLLGSEVKELSNLLEGAQPDEEPEFWVIVVGTEPVMCAGGRTEAEAWADACSMGNITKQELIDEGYYSQHATASEYEALCRGEIYALVHRTS